MQEGVRTLSVRVGVKTVFWTCIVLMEVAYAGAIGVGMMSQVRSSCHAHMRLVRQCDPAKLRDRADALFSRSCGAEA